MFRTSAALRVRRSVLLGAGVLALAGAMAATEVSSSASGSTGSLTTVNVNLIPIADLASVYLGNKQGFFAQNGLKLKITASIAGGPVIIPTLISGQDQFGIPAYTDQILADVKGLPLVSIGSADAAGPTNNTDYQYLVTLKSSKITSVKQLAGKTIAINSLNGLGETQVDAALQNAGVNYHTVHYTAINFPQMAAALDSGQVVAAQVVEPFYSMLRLGTKPINTLAGLDYAIAPNLPVTSVLVTKSYYASHHAIVVEFQKALKESLAYTQAHLAAARALLPSYAGITASLSTKVLMPYFPTTLNTAGVQKIISDMFNFGIITKKPSLSSIIEPNSP
jgi:NitT/TauT family transport system substrate-binding protein